MLADRAAKLDSIVIAHGAHKTPEEGMCSMELVAWLAGEEHSDAPQCACPVIARAMIRLNDRISDAKLRTDLLLPLLPRLIGSRASREVMTKRGFVAADMAVRVFLPIALEVRGLHSEAARWRDSAEVKDRPGAIAARDGIRAKKYAADAAADAAAYAAADAAADAADAARRRRLRRLRRRRRRLRRRLRRSRRRRRRPEADLRASR